MEKMIEFIATVIDDTMKEDKDGQRRWSFLRLTAFVWVVVGLLPSAILYYLKGLAISSEISIITGVVLLGLPVGKAGTTLQNYVTTKKDGGEAK